MFKTMGFVLVVALLLQFASTEPVAASCPAGTFNENGKCCKLCLAGTFLVSACDSNGGDSVCEACPNKTFMSSPTKQKNCDPCKRCPVSQIMNAPCTSTHNTDCTCKEGKYFDLGLLYCMECSACKRGFGAWKACSTEANTDCRPCPKGTFSNSVSISEPCKKCATCPIGYREKTTCTPYNDTRCAKINTTTNDTTSTKASPAASRGTSPLRHNTRPTGGDKEWLIPLVSVMFAILVFLLAVGGWHYRRTLAVPCRRDSESCGSRDEDTEITDQELAIPLNPLCAEEQPPHATRGVQHRGLRGRHKNNAPRRTERESSDSQGSTGSLQGGDKPRGKVTLVRDLPANIIESLALLLNPSSKNDWARLASELGYSGLEISNWKLVPQEATQRLLQDWQTRDTSTTEKLYRTLTNIKRDDAAALIRPYR